ncbi:MAG: SH3 domain-containing protein [Planctomycetes bacterium]|nr:SH3 domain-containing protein [Planctomycetota bacterium]MCC7171755.1 SH3 domain-containing protein [Planctomycetota bacterium]
MAKTPRGILSSSFRGWRVGLALWALCAGAGVAFAQEGETLTPLQIEKDPIAWMGGKSVVAVARVAADGAEFRSGPDPNYRVVRRAEPGTLVLIVGYHPNHFCEILVPTGVRAYVHSRFMQVDDDGLGRCHEERVNVRSIPSSQGDYPIGQIGPGDVLLVWNKTGPDQDWYEVTPPGRLTVYVEDTALDLVGTLDDATAVEIADARSALYARFAAAADESKERDARAAAEAALRVEYDRLVAAIEVQRARGPDAEYDAIENDLTRLGVETDDADLLRDIEAKRELVATLTQSADRERKLRARQEQEREESERRARETATRAPAVSPVTTPTQPQPTTPPAAAGTSGEWVGFLRSRDENGGVAYSVEQGARVLVRIDGGSKRYRWADFVGLQVRVRGRVIQSGGVPTIDVTKLEIQR